MEISRQKELADAYVNAKQRYTDIVSNAKKDFKLTLKNIHQQMGIE